MGLLCCGHMRKCPLPILMPTQHGTSMQVIIWPAGGGEGWCWRATLQISRDFGNDRYSGASFPAIAGTLEIWVLFIIFLAIRDGQSGNKICEFPAIWCMVTCITWYQCKNESIFWRVISKCVLQKRFGPIEIHCMLRWECRTRGSACSHPLQAVQGTPKVYWRCTHHISRTS